MWRRAATSLPVALARYYETIRAGKLTVGSVLVKDDKLWKVRGTSVINPGLRVAVIKLELKELIGEATQQARYSTTDTVEVAELDSPQHYTLLYSSGDDAFLFMHNQTFEQIEIRADVLGEETLPYLVDGMQVQIQKYDGQPVTVQLPKTVVVEIADCEPTVKNASATETGGKTASTASGLRLKVPSFIQKGDKIAISTKDGSYVERVYKE